MFKSSAFGCGNFFNIMRAVFHSLARVSGKSSSAFRENFIVMYLWMRKYTINLGSHPDPGWICHGRGRRSL